MECSLAPRDLRSAWKVPGGRHMSTSFDSSSRSSVLTSSPHSARTDVALAAVARATPAPASAAKPSATAGVQSMSWTDRLTLAAIGVVVVVVTLPVLRGFGLRENELDAVRMLRALAALPAPSSEHAASNRPSALADLASSDLILRKRLEDLEALPDGRLRRHGYLFDWLLLAPGEPMLRAWPWEHARTGRGAFVWTPSRGLLGHRNVDGRFSGAGFAPEPEDVEIGGWVAMPRR